MEKTRYWISFDLGLRGDYGQLYEWLDQAGARECGDSVATFLSGKTREQITQELSTLLGEDKNARVYIITRRRGGKFVLGKRKAGPWVGYAEQLVESEEER